MVGLEETHPAKGASHMSLTSNGWVFYSEEKIANLKDQPVLSSSFCDTPA